MLFETVFRKVYCFYKSCCFCIREGMKELFDILKLVFILVIQIWCSENWFTDMQTELYKPWYIFKSFIYFCLPLSVCATCVLQFFQRIPFAVVGSNTVLEVGGKKIRGRKYPWGIVEGMHLCSNYLLFYKFFFISVRVGSTMLYWHPLFFFLFSWKYRPLWLYRVTKPSNQVCVVLFLSTICICHCGRFAIRINNLY